MAIPNTVPIVRVHQEFMAIPSELTENLLACVVGPHYDLVRYNQASEKDRGLLGAYNPALGVTSTWPNKPVGGVVDQDWTRMFVESALLEYFVDEIDAGSEITVGDTPSAIVSDTLVFKTANGVNRSAAFGDRDVQVGDRAVVSDGDGNTLEARVIGFDFEKTASAIALVGDGADSNNQGNLSEGVNVTKNSGEFVDVGVAGSAASYDGLADGYPQDSYTFICTKSAPDGSPLESYRFRIESASGKDNVSEFQFVDGYAAAHSFGARGASITLSDTSGGSDEPSIKLGDRFLITYTQDYVQPDIIASGTYTGAVDRRYVIKVVGINASDLPICVISTTDSSDFDGPKAVSVGATPTPIGNFGVLVRFDITGNPPAPGDRYYVDATAEADGKADTLILNRKLPDDMQSEYDLELRLMIQTDIEVPRYSNFPTTNFSTTADEVSLNDSLQVEHATLTNDGEPVSVPVVGGQVYVQYRSLLPDFNGGRSEIRNIGDVQDVVGPPSVHNPLGLAVYMAVLASQGQPVGFISVITDNLAGYNTALSRIRDDIRNYSLVPTTQDAEILESVKAHLLAQSHQNRSRFRVGWLSTPEARNLLVTDEDSDGQTLTAKFEYSAVFDANVVLTSDGSQFIADGVQPGDVVRANFSVDGHGEETYDTFVVDQVVSESELRLVSGPEDATSVEDRVEVWRNLNPQDEAEEYAGRSSGFGHRRVRHIWPPTVDTVIGDEPQVPAWAAAASLAGTRSAAAPHQPLSNVELPGISGVSYSDGFTESELDALAQSGTWVLTRSPQGGPVYTRLALTTDTTNLNVAQDHRTTNADSISFGFINRVKNLVGNVNITARTLEVIANEIMTVRAFFQSEARTPNLGPQLIDATILDGPRQSEVNQDTVEVDVELELPYELVALNMRLQIT